MGRRRRVPYVPPETHVFDPSGMINRRREPLCTCGLPRRNARHKDFEVTDDMRAADAARLGEHD